MYSLHYMRKVSSSYYTAQKAKENSPNRFDISELCIFGLSDAIFLRCNRDHTINAFIGRFICSSCIRFADCTIILSKCGKIKLKNKSFILVSQRVWYIFHIPRCMGLTIFMFQIVCL